MKPTQSTLVVLLVGCLCTSGCATIFNGSKERIQVEAPKDSEIRVNGQYVGTGQASTTIAKKGEVIITASKEGCQTHSVKVERTFDAVTLLGILIDGGIFTILLIDGAMTGAWSKAVTKYYQLSPQCPSE